MFNKKECSNCRKKVNQNYEFCPFCGNTIYGKQKDFGMLGKNDSPENLQDFTQNLFQGFGGGILNKMLGNAMKMLEKEMQHEMKMQKKHPQSNLQLFVNGKRINIPNQNQEKPIEEKKQKINSIHFSSENQEKFASLKQKEPNTTLKRLGDVILYDILIPQVESLKDISIVKLENSVEIKAISEDTSYFKSIPINLELTGYEFDNEKLILEFEGN